VTAQLLTKVLLLRHHVVGRDELPGEVSDAFQPGSIDSAGLQAHVTVFFP
jgi:hypothetical protein